MFRQLEINPLNKDAFAPFGDVIEIENAERLMESLRRTSDPARFLGSFLKVTNTLYQTLDLEDLLSRQVLLACQ